MYSFLLNGKAYNFPEKATELTLGQFIEIGKANDELQLLSILIGETPTTNISTPKEAEQFDKGLKNIYKMVDMFKIDLELCLSSGILLVVPKQVDVIGLTIQVKPLNTLPYWGYIHVRNAIQSISGKDELFNATELIPGMLAHCLYSLVTKSQYNEAKAEEFKEVILQMPFIHAMQLGNFFLFQQKKIWTSRRKRLIMNLTIWRLRLVSKFSTSTGQSILSKPLPEGIF